MAAASVYAYALAFALVCSAVNSQTTTLVPGIITFGDSVVDVGNNDYIHTIFKANYPPYGRDFKNKEATGRFCNGKLATDITADTLGFTNYPPAYLSPQATGKNLLLGANFASAGSGYDDHTSLVAAGSSDFVQNYYVNPVLSKVYTPDQYSSSVWIHRAYMDWEQGESE